MDKFTVFIDMLEFVDTYSNVVDADLNYYRDTMKIVGEYEGEKITIEVTIIKKEEGSENA